MFSPKRRRLGYANVVATLALVFAMSGGALAAGRYLITSTKQISPKVLKSLRGTKGAAGAAGAQGAQGVQGPQGAAGAKGETGPAGAKGETGAAGAAGPAGPKGATGVPGLPGETGFTKTLPAGETEEGTWYITTNQGNYLFTSISFTIPLAFAPTFENGVDHYIPKNGAPTTQCPGSVADPKAAPGNLCIYAAADESGEVTLSHGEGSTKDPEGANGESGSNNPGKSGAIVRFEGTEPEQIAYGDWAVTEKE